MSDIYLLIYVFHDYYHFIFHFFTSLVINYLSSFKFNTYI